MEGLHIRRQDRVALLLAIVLAAVPSVALASSRTPAEATQHALDELANVCAQRRPECPATLTPTPTTTPSPTSTMTPQPTDTPTPEATATVTPTLEPVCWLTNLDLGDPDNNWIVFDDQGAPVPCPIPTEETPIAEPIDTPAPPPTATPRPLPQTAPAASGSAPAPLPTYTPYPTYTPQPTYTPAPSATPLPPTSQAAGVVVTAIPTLTPPPSPTAIVTSAAAVVATPQPTTAPVRTAAFSQLRVPSLERPWLYASLLLLLGIGTLAAIWLVRRGRRSYAP